MSMSPFIVDAVYENGVLKPVQPLPLQEHERVQIQINMALSRVHATYGLIPWTGDHETLRRIAEDDEFGIMESP